MQASLERRGRTLVLDLAPRKDGSLASEVCTNLSSCKCVLRGEFISESLPSYFLSDRVHLHACAPGFGQVPARVQVSVVVGCISSR